MRRLLDELQSELARLRGLIENPPVLSLPQYESIQDGIVAAILLIKAISEMLEVLNRFKRYQDLSGGDNGELAG
jgi:hypothetical protein